MKLHATIADGQTDVLIQDDGSCVHAEIDGRCYDLDVRESGASGYLLITEAAVFDCRVDGRPDSGKSIEVIVGATQYSVTLADPKRLQGASGAVAHAGEAARIVAPMPGKVVRVLVNVGDQVEAGAGIVVVEAMKMQNEMKSPKAGTVVALKVDVGATVNAGDVLAIVE
ncbi:MAG TPA: biotin/lipoyl-containing protein [Pyrinomonadaceae bacterium]|nr:biotin/lipoyl-containing protein [Pyrinomonadaceae bacterium]